MEIDEPIKYIDVKEFKEKGYLQELNRLFLHPLGLAMVVTSLNNGTEFISGIMDAREDPNGMVYDLQSSNKERVYRFVKNASFILNERAKRWPNRSTNNFNNGIETIPFIP